MNILGVTWIQDEEKAYNVPLTASPRRGKVFDKNGKLIIVRLGIPDTFFSIPAFYRIGRGHRIYGFVSVKEETFHFTEYQSK